jgi:hypothetical protein
MRLQGELQMRSVLAIGLSMMLVATPSVVRSQDHEARCNGAVAKHCGETPIGECFSDDKAWEAVPEDCIGDIQTAIEGEREAREQQAQDAALDPPGLSDLMNKTYGRSYGGLLRAGPGMQHPKRASVAEGERIRVLEKSAETLEGYTWYRVMTSHGEGFQWGGLFCTDGPDPLEGVLTVCGSEHEASYFGTAADSASEGD